MTPAAVGELYARYGHLVLRRCRRLLGSTPEAEDLLHDVFLRASASQPPRANGSALVWLYRIATNCCYDALRRRRRDLAQQAALTAAHGDAVHEADGDRRAFLALVLRDVDRVVCELGLLHHVDGLTQEEIALESGYSRKTVGRKLKAFSEEFAARWHQGGGA